MSLLGKKSKNSGCTGCGIANYVALVLLAIGTIATVIGVYKAHLLPAGATFGTSNGSLSLIAFVLAVTLLKKTFCGCCGCDEPSKK